MEFRWVGSFHWNFPWNFDGLAAEYYSRIKLTPAGILCLSQHSSAHLHGKYVFSVFGGGAKYTVYLVYLVRYNQIHCVLGEYVSGTALDTQCI